MSMNSDFNPSESMRVSRVQRQRPDSFESSHSEIFEDSSSEPIHPVPESLSEILHSFKEELSNGIQQCFDKGLLKGRIQNIKEKEAAVSAPLLHWLMWHKPNPNKNEEPPPASKNDTLIDHVLWIDKQDFSTEKSTSASRVLFKKYLEHSPGQTLLHLYQKITSNTLTSERLEERISQTAKKIKGSHPQVSNEEQEIFLKIFKKLCQDFEIFQQAKKE